MPHRLSSNTKIFILLCISLFIKCILFHYCEYGNFKVSSIRDAIQFYGSTVAITGFISAFVFIIKNNRWWTTVIQIIIDLWIIANMIYLRSNGLFLNIDDMLMSDNMSGFWNSIFAYLNWRMAIFPLITFAYIIVISRIKNPANRCAKASLTIWLLCFLFIPVNNFSRSGDKVYRLIIPYLKAADKAQNLYSGSKIETDWEEKYVANHNVINYFVGSFVYFAVKEFYQKKYSQNIQLSADDELLINQLFHQDQRDSINSVHTPLVIILCESLESWAIEYVTEDGRQLMPNLYNFMHRDSAFYANKVKSQVKKGISGDGQMTINTGLLPCNSGAACRLYADNVFPNLAHFYMNSITLNPAPGIWNQMQINPAYGIKELYESPDMFNDEMVFEELLKRLKSLDDNSFIMAITVDTHAPFEMASNVDFEIDSQMPLELSKYLKCVHYLDECMKEVLSELAINSNITTVITGDHTIFKSSLLKEFHNYAASHNLPIADGNNYCPLIIKSPSIHTNTTYTEECYQMDIYPTILYAINMSDTYWWKGFGINLLDNHSQRILDENQAYSLSDKILRSNYFKKLAPTNAIGSSK